MSDQILLRQWESKFREMERRWSEIGQKTASRDLRRWEMRFAEMSEEYQSLVAGGKWVSGPVDVLSIIGKDEDERTHSRILAWLLTPTGRHGLGNRLLTRLLKYYDSKQNAEVKGELQVDVNEAGHLYNVECSYWRKGREADVYAWDEDFSLVIEMKVNAAEGTRQLTDLYDNFNSEGARFLFLTREGGEPTTATGEAQRAFETISWRQVRGMIEAALMDSVGPKGEGSAVVENYLTTLKERFE